MDPKSAVMKSKSSNSAISKMSEDGLKQQYNKKAKSNANFPCRGLKKRGVYVEKRLTKMNLVNNDKEVDCITQKPPPRPRPGQKKFLASCLSILSKSTTGTQYPEVGEGKKDRIRETGRTKGFFKRKNTNNDDVKVNDPKNLKDKFKSRVLNKKFVREDKKKMVVLQSKKEIAQTPSNYSEWSYKDASQYSNMMVCEDLNNNDGLNVADELKNAILEGRSVKVKKLRYLDDEPKTLVSDAPKDQKNLYSFFVDLLETTISVYNVKAEYDANAPSEVSKTNLQINESVANKLNINKTEKTIKFEDGIVSPQHLFHIQNDTDYNKKNVYPKTRLPADKPFKRQTPFETAKIRKLKTDSFVYSNNIKRIPNKSNSVDISRKTTFRNKNDLLNVLKQELEVDSDTFEEPQSIFQALRLMARNKKKISFHPSIDYKNFTDECVLRRRKVISSRKVKKNNKERTNINITKPVRPIFNNTIYLHNTRKPNKDIDRQISSETDLTESYHSLEVYGFDYERNALKQTSYKPKDFTLPYHSSPSNSDLDFDVQDPILTSPSTLSSIRKFSAVVD